MVRQSQTELSLRRGENTMSPSVRKNQHLNGTDGVKPSWVYGTYFRCSPRAKPPSGALHGCCRNLLVFSRLCREHTVPFRKRGDKEIGKQFTLELQRARPVLVVSSFSRPLYFGQGTLTGFFVWTFFYRRRPGRVYFTFAGVPLCPTRGKS